MIVDYHVHTEFSDDSVCPMEQQIEKGIEIGLSQICFTDHVDYGIKKDWIEGNIQYRGGEPLANVDYPKYFEKLEKMKEVYRDQIIVKNGLEFGVQTHTIPQYEALYQKYHDVMDFALLSIHQVEDQEFWNQAFQQGRTQQEYNERYYKEMYDVVKAYKGYSCLAHMDLLTRYDQAGIYPFDKVKDMIAEILKVVIRDGKGIEMNTSSWHYQLTDTTPSREILSLYKDLGGTILTMGSDAHITQYLGDHMVEGQQILQELGFKGFTTFTKWNPEFHEF